MRKKLLFAWLTSAVCLFCVHYGPGQKWLHKERASRLSGEAAALEKAGRWQEARTTYEAALAALPEDGADEQGGQQDPGQNAGHKELADGLLGLDAVDDQDHAGRDEDTQRAPGSHGAIRQGWRIVVFFHFRQRHRSHGCGGSHAVPANGCETTAADDRPYGKAPGQTPEPFVTHIVQLGAYA